MKNYTKKILKIEVVEDVRTYPVVKEAGIVSMDENSAAELNAQSENTLVRYDLIEEDAQGEGSGDNENPQ